uniref:Protein FAR1-RELATED SEQUENCE n=1 Tax=Oryza rufipogon TaxID=4529 RepID=A0A0E0MUI9_ORYRU
MEDKVPKVGMKFNSEQEAYDLYNAYAGEKGFSIRRSSYHHVLEVLIREQKLQGMVIVLVGQKLDASVKHGNLEVPNDQAFLHVSRYYAALDASTSNPTHVSMTPENQGLHQQGRSIQQFDTDLYNLFN